MTYEKSQLPNLSETYEAHASAIEQIVTSAEQLLNHEKAFYSFQRITVTDVNGVSTQLSQTKGLSPMSSHFTKLTAQDVETSAIDEWFHEPDNDDIYPYNLMSGVATDNLQHHVFSGSNGVERVYDLRTGDKYQCPPGSIEEASRDELVNWFLRKLDNKSAMALSRVRFHNDTLLNRDRSQQIGDPCEFVHIKTLRHISEVHNDYPDSYYQFKLKTDESKNEHAWLIVGENESFVTTSHYDEVSDEDIVSRRPATLAELQHVGTKLAEYAAA